jgi:cyclohexyl-isocyanide hydratase
MTMIPHDTHLHIGSLLFEGIDQIDLTRPFEVLSRIPNATYRIYGKTAAPVRDLRGLRLTPDATLADAPPLDVLHVPGGYGQEALMEDAQVLGWIRQQASGPCSIFSVCTGALICGAAGLLKGRRATTHWSAFHCCHSSARSPSTNGWSSTPPATHGAISPPIPKRITSIGMRDWAHIGQSA